MISLAAAILDRHAAGTPASSADLDSIPKAQWEIYFAELSALCPSRIALDVERRPGNALNIEIGTPAPRCSQRSPDGRGLVWLRSGGSALAYGTCSASRCPRLSKVRS